jgi:hypothetical protein
MWSGALPLTVQYAGLAGYEVCAGSLNGSRDPDATVPGDPRDPDLQKLPPDAILKGVATPGTLGHSLTSPAKPSMFSLSRSGAREFP